MLKYVQKRSHFKLFYSFIFHTQCVGVLACILPLHVSDYNGCLPLNDFLNSFSEVK